MTGCTPFLTRGCHNTNVSTQARWCAWCQCHSWSCYGVLKYCEVYLPLAGRAETPSPTLPCAITFMGCYYVIWKYWLMPKSISVPCNAVRTKISPWSWVRNRSYCRPDHSKICLCLDSETFNTDVLISACCFWLGCVGPSAHFRPCQLLYF